MLPYWTQPLKHSSCWAREHQGVHIHFYSRIHPLWPWDRDKTGASHTCHSMAQQSYMHCTQTEVSCPAFSPRKIIMWSDMLQLLASDSEELQEQKPLGAHAKSSQRKQLFQSWGCCHLKQGFSQSFLVFVEITICLQTMISQQIWKRIRTIFDVLRTLGFATGSKYMKSGKWVRLLRTSIKT